MGGVLGLARERGSWLSGTRAAVAAAAVPARASGRTSVRLVATAMPNATYACSSWRWMERRWNVIMSSFIVQLLYVAGICRGGEAWAGEREGWGAMGGASG